MKMKLIQTENYLLLIDEEAEIKELINIGDYFLGKDLNGKYSFIGKCHNKTYHQNLYYCWTDNKDEGGFGLKYKIIAYRKLNSEAKELDLPELPPFENDKINLAKLQAEYAIKEGNGIEAAIHFGEGYKAAQSDKQFSLEDMETIMEEALNWFGGGRDEDITDSETFFERYIQSLSIQQLPSEFIPEYEERGTTKFWAAFYSQNEKGVDNPDNFVWHTLKTITNSEGREEIQGRYVY